MSSPNGPDDSDHEAEKPKVGYKRPPVETRFKPGTSGNPAGKRKSDPVKKWPVSKRKFLDTMLEESNRLVLVLEGGKQKKMTAVRAMIRSLINVAMKDHKTFKQIMSLILAAEAIKPDLVRYDLSKITIDEGDTLVKLLRKCSVEE